MDGVLRQLPNTMECQNDYRGWCAQSQCILHPKLHLHHYQPKGLRNRPVLRRRSSMKWMMLRMHSSILSIQINRASQHHSRTSPLPKSQIKFGISLLWIMVLDVSISYQTWVGWTLNNPSDTCVGYNTLFVIPTLSQPNGKDLPDGKRLWTWLIQCDDGMSRTATPHSPDLEGSRWLVCRHNNINPREPVRKTAGSADRWSQASPRHCAQKHSLYFRWRFETALCHVRERVANHHPGATF